MPGLGWEQCSVGVPVRMNRSQRQAKSSCSASQVDPDIAACLPATRFLAISSSPCQRLEEVPVRVCVCVRMCVPVCVYLPTCGKIISAQNPLAASLLRFTRVFFGFLFQVNWKSALKVSYRKADCIQIWARFMPAADNEELSSIKQWNSKKKHTHTQQKRATLTAKRATKVAPAAAAVRLSLELNKVFALKMLPFAAVAFTMCQCVCVCVCEDGGGGGRDRFY